MAGSEMGLRQRTSAASTPLRRRLPCWPGTRRAADCREAAARVQAGGMDGGLAQAARGGRWPVLRRLFLVVDVVAAVAAGGAAGALGGLAPAGALALVLALALAWPGGLALAGLYAAGDLRRWASGVSEAPRAMVAAAALSWPLWAAVAALGGAHPDRAALAGSATALAVGCFGRAVARALAHRSSALRERTLIVGSGLVAGRVVDEIRRHPEVGLDPIGIVDDDPHGAEPLALPVLGRLEELPAVLRRHAVDQVVIAFSRAGHQELLGAIRACRDTGVPAHVVPRLFELLDGTGALDQIGGLPLLSIGSCRLTRSSAAAKRALDLTLAATALVVLMPLLGAVAVAIKLDSTGPVLFRQVRAGRGGRPFRLVKFRSMYADADARKLELQRMNEAQDAVMFKIRRDPRITRVGRFLRRTSLDEVPQLWNVLRGEMSLVGPRPLILPESDALVEGWHARRLDLRPGLTGPWQVSGRSDVSVHEMVRFDYLYVAGWSLARDFEILLATVPAVLSGRGAY